MGNPNGFVQGREFGVSHLSPVFLWCPVLRRRGCQGALANSVLDWLRNLSWDSGNVYSGRNFEPRGGTLLVQSSVTDMSTCLEEETVGCDWAGGGAGEMCSVIELSQLKSRPLSPFFHLPLAVFPWERV